MLHDLGWQSLDGRRQDQRLDLFLQINGLASVETEDILSFITKTLYNKRGLVGQSRIFAH